MIERFEKNSTSPDATANGLINALAFIHLEKNAGVKHIRWQDLPETQSLVYKLAVAQSLELLRKIAANANLELAGNTHV